MRHEERGNDPQARFRRELRRILERCVRFSRQREITFHCGDVALTLGPSRPASDLDDFVRRADAVYIHVTGLGLRSEAHRVRWHRLRFSLWRRLLHTYLGLVCSLLPASELKSRLYRAMGMRIGRNVEISIGAFLDPFSPGLISIGDDTVIGAFAMLFTHAYRGRGRMFFGRLTIGKGCLIGALTTIGPCVIEDSVTVLPGVVSIPFLQRISAGSIIGMRQRPKDLRNELKEFPD